MRVSSPAILYMLGIISSRPCDEVNVVARAPACSAPWSAPAAPPSLCISMTFGTVPQMFLVADRRPGVGRLAHRRGRRNGINSDHFADVVGHVGDRLIAVERHFVSRHGASSRRLAFRRGTYIVSASPDEFGMKGGGRRSRKFRCFHVVLSPRPASCAVCLST